jgi:hypothetical protein
MSYRPSYQEEVANALITRDLVVNGTITFSGGFAGSTGIGTYACPATVAIGDIVYLSAGATVDKASAVSSVTAAMGVVLTKPTALSALVLFGEGEASVFAGLTPTAQYYLSLIPGTAIIGVVGLGAGNIVQRIGQAKSATVMIMKIVNDFTIL